MQRTSRREVQVRRPDGLVIDVKGDGVDRRFWFDGTTATVLERRENLYASVELPGTTAEALDILARQYKRSIPLADFLRPDIANELAAFTEDGALLVANLLEDQVGRVAPDQESDDITQVVSVTPAPTDIEIVGERALVVSGNLDESFAPLGEGVVTALSPTTLEILGTVSTGGQNPSAAAVGPDGLLYVLNTGDFVNPATLAIIDPVTLERIDLIEDAGVGAGAISVDGDGTRPARHPRQRHGPSRPGGPTWTSTSAESSASSQQHVCRHPGPGPSLRPPPTGRAPGTGTATAL